MDKTQTQTQTEEMKRRDIGIRVIDENLSGDGIVRRKIQFRSEERRVGKECRSRWSPYH